MTGLILHNYFRSSASVRVRAALNLKGLTYDYVGYHLRKGRNREPDYLDKNPQGLVPALELANGNVLTQSMAIIEFLEEEYSEPALLPQVSVDRARVRAIASAISCDIHPLNNLRVLAFLRKEFGADDGAVTKWFQHWVKATFEPIEIMLSSDLRTGKFCHGDRPGLADVCLFAQMLNNRRFDVDVRPYPTIVRIHAACMELPAFQAALPDRQPDAE